MSGLRTNLAAATEEALRMATLSYCEKRKVGAVVTDAEFNILSKGCNNSADGSPCEDSAGATKSNVIHAEINAINSLKASAKDRVHAILVTQPPCEHCRLAIEEAGIDEIIVVESFMKFDAEKLRYDLIPVAWHEGDAEILTHGAKKYKPNNWKEVDDIGRYIAALERHLAEFKKYYETGSVTYLTDEDSGLHHMKHLRTNAGFLLTLTEDKVNED